MGVPNIQVLPLLQSSSLFCGIEIKELQQLAQSAELHTYLPKEIIIEQGILSSKVIFILDGLVKVYQLTPDGKEIFLAIEKKQEFLGVMELQDKPGSAMVEALNKTTVLAFPKKELNKLLKIYPVLWKQLYNILLKKLEENKRLQTIRLSNDLYQRTYVLLKYLANLASDKTVRLSQENIATIVGATRPRVTETLQLLSETNKITISHKNITFLA